MDTPKEKREEVLKILEMVGQGKIDQDKALTMIAMLEGKDVIGGPNGVVKGRKSGVGRLLGGVVGVVILVGLLYGLFIYLPVNAPERSVIAVYSFLGLVLLAGTVIALVAVTKALGIGRLAVERGAPNGNAPPPKQDKPQ